MSNEGVEGPVTYRYGSDNQGTGGGTDRVCRGTMGAPGGPQAFSMKDSGAAMLDVDRSSCHLSLLVVVNTAMVGLVATMVFAAVELATHVVS
jgi:hypothetical protein